MEVIFFTSHVGERRWLVYFCRRTPDKEISILVGQEVNIESIVQQFHTHIRLMIGQAPTHPETFVVSLFAISFVGEEINTSANVEITDTAGVGKVESFVNRIAYTTKKASTQDRFHCVFILFPKALVAPLIFIIFCITIYTNVSTEPGFRR